MSEKTFKPLAFYHPFVVYGRPGVLKRLHYLGFETFPELFDESYDQIEDDQARLSQVVSAIDNFKMVPHNNIILEKFEHNHNLFYNTSSINYRINIDIIEPILNFASQS